MVMTDFEVRTAQYLSDTGYTIFTTALIDAGLIEALHEYSKAAILPGARVKPYLQVGTFTPANGVRETNIYAQTWMRNYLDIQAVWYPYVASNVPQPVDFRLIENSGQALLSIDDVLGDGVSVARVFVRCVHQIKDLLAETTTTVEVGDEDPICKGAAGFAIQARGLRQNEDTSLTIWTVPNYLKLSAAYLAEFRAAIAPRKVARNKKLVSQPLSIYRADTLS